MKRTPLAVAFAAALSLAVGAVPARAGFYIGVRGGLSNQNASQDGASGKIEFDKNSAFLYGAQAGLRFSALAVEGEFYRADHNLMAGASSLSTGGVDMNYYYLGVNGKLGIPLVIAYPYITVGYGRYSADLKGIGSSSDTGINVGAGAELSLGKVSLFAEVRYTDFGFDLGNISWDFGGVDVHFGLNIHL